MVFAEALASAGNESEIKNVMDTIAILEAQSYDVRVFAPELFAPDNIRYCTDNIFDGHDINFCAFPNEKTKPEWFLTLPTPEKPQ